MGDDLLIDLEEFDISIEDTEVPISDQKAVHKTAIENILKKKKEKVNDVFREFKKENEEIDKVRMERRQFSEKLEKDKKFREAYLAAEERKRKERELLEQTAEMENAWCRAHGKSDKLDNEFDDVIKPIHSNDIADQDRYDVEEEFERRLVEDNLLEAKDLERLKVLRQTEELPEPKKTKQKSIVYINNVESLVLNISI
jgi:hypothetical protein